MMKLTQRCLLSNVSSDKCFKHCRIDELLGKTEKLQEARQTTLVAKLYFLKGHQLIYMFTGVKIITERLDKWKLSVINPASSISVKSDFPIFVNCGLFLITLLYIGMFVYEPNPNPNTTQTNVQLKYLLKHHYLCNKYLL